MYYCLIRLCRLPLHQNIVFGRLPSSLHQPAVPSSSLLCGSLYWAHATQKTAEVAGTDYARILSSVYLHGTASSMMISKDCEISVPYEPLLLTQNRENDSLLLVTDMLQWGTHIAESLFSNKIDSTDESLQEMVEGLASRIHSYCKLLHILQSLGGIASRVISKASTETIARTAFALLNTELRAIQCAQQQLRSAEEVMKTSSAVLVKLQAVINDSSSSFVQRMSFLCRLIDIHLFHGRPCRKEDSPDSELLRVLLEKDISSAKIIVSPDYRENSYHYENYVATETAAMFSRCLRNNIIPAVQGMLMSPSPYRASIALLRLIIAGGWPAPLSLHSSVSLNPRALFLTNDNRNLELAIFPCYAVTKSPPLNAGRANGIWLHNCPGFFSRVENICIPKNPMSVGLATEMVSPIDRMPLHSLRDSVETEKSVIISREALLGMLKCLIQSAPSKLVGRASPVDVSPTEVNACHPIELQLLMSHIRAIASQLAFVETDATQLLPFLNDLLEYIAKSFENILSIAGIDPVSAVISAFNTSANRGAGQLDVLSNLLREGDIPFLERISLRSWKQYKSQHKPTPHNYCPIAAIAGDVQITGNRIRALGHFPSVRVLPIELTKMTGRWFYEVTLLTDGLMQIGWADKNFRCDPVCGQGVGDHSHSWALDGLRTKKWNVSCESYGVRWKPEDVIGVLVDMDLLEMKFFMNGEDLGVAFSGFSSVGLFPALSLNVRQCIRVNYGQSRFMYPPDEIDGYPFKSVLLALEPSLARPAEFTRGLSALDSIAQNENRGEEEDSESLSQSALDRQITVDGEDIDAEHSTTPPSEASNAVWYRVSNFAFTLYSIRRCAI